MITLLLATTQKLISKSNHPGELNSFSHWLADNNYKSFPIHRHISRLNKAFKRMGKFDDLRTYDVKDLKKMFDFGNDPSYLYHECNAVRRTYSRYLQANGRLRTPSTDNPFGILSEEYNSYLIEVRGLSKSARVQHAITIKDFLRRGVETPNQLKKVSLNEVEKFIFIRSLEISRDSMQHVTGHLRAFLKYCYEKSYIESRVDNTIETPRTHRSELPPRAMPWDDVQVLLESIDLKGKSGWRDYCILHLISHYGLRPIEIVSLKLDSINFEAGVVKVTQHKTRSNLILPLTHPTIRILKSYLVNDRMRQGNTHPDLFLRVRCPDGPLLTSGVQNIFAKRMRAAKLSNMNFSVYSLRHSFAMRLLSSGVGIKVIADLLGHRRIDTTCSYLRLDIEALREVALDVPGIDACQGGTYVHD